VADDLEAARKEVEDEYRQVRKALDRVREELGAVEQAGPYADVYDLLGKLEDAVKEARTGGIVGSGAKGHRGALEEYRRLGG
jgi:hypothetical protein